MTCALPAGAGATPLLALSSPSARSLPVFVLWAWERAEDFTFLQNLPATEPIEVAAVVRTVRLQAARAYSYRRTQPLKVPANIRITPVVHVDALTYSRPELNAAQRDSLVAAILDTARDHGGRVQLDFEASRSQRAFYRDVISAVRAAAPHIDLSVTALTSWCASDRWIGALPVDDIVPMLFRMGRDNAGIRARLEQTGRLPDPRCNGIGIATDEVWPATLRYARIHVFAPRAWTARELMTLKEKFAR